MTSQFVQLLPVLAAALLALVLAIVSLTRRNAPGNRAFALLMTAALAWSLAYFLAEVTNDFDERLFWSKAQYIGSSIVPTAWLAVAIRYTQRLYLAGWRILVLAIHPAIVIPLAWSNDYHGLIWSDVTIVSTSPVLVADFTNGWAYWVHVVYSFAITAAGVAIFFRTFAQRHSLYTRQGVAVLMAVAGPTITHLLWITNVWPLAYDPTPFGVAASGLALAWGLFRFGLFDIVPVAKDAVVDGLIDGVFVVDQRGRVVDMNPAASSILGISRRDGIGGDIADVLSPLGLPIGDYLRAGSGRSETTLQVAGDERQYEVVLSRLATPQRSSSGSVVLMRDITLAKRAEAAVRESNERLEARVEERTTELLKATEELRQSRLRLVSAQEETRRSVAEQLHGPVQNRLLVALHSLQVAQSRVEEETSDMAAALTRATGLIDGIARNELRAAMRRLHPPLIRVSLLSSLQMLAHEFGDSVEVDFSVSGAESDDEFWRTGLLEDLRLAVYRVTEESLNNVLKHAHASRVGVSLEVTAADRIAVHVSDNGRGFDPTVASSGFGVLSMRDYCGALGGTLRTSSSVGKGTTVSVEFPVAATPTAAEVTETHAETQARDELKKPVTRPEPGSDDRTTRIIVVDDQPDFCVFVRDLLSSSVDSELLAEAHNAEEALEQFERLQPDVVLLDVEMPEVHGIDTLVQLVSRYPYAKVIMMSAYHEEEQFLPEARRLGAHDYIPKADLSLSRLAQSIQTGPMSDGKRVPTGS